MTWTDADIQAVINRPYITARIDARGKCIIDGCNKPFPHDNLTTDEVIEFLKHVKTKPIVMMEFDYDVLGMRGTYVPKKTLYKMLAVRKETLGY